MSNPFRAIPTTVIDRHGNPKHWHNCGACYGASRAEIANCDVCSGNGYVEGTPVACPMEHDEAGCEVVAADIARHEAEEAAADAVALAEAMPVSGRFDLGAEIALQASAHRLLNPLLYGRGGK